MCRLKGCNNKDYLDGLCNKHYKEKLQGGIKTCSVVGCNRLPHTTGYCKRHYQQLHINGEVLISNNRDMNNKVLRCKAPLCTRNAKKMGYCERHYEQVKKYGRLTPELEKSVSHIKVCIIDGCDKKTVARSLCSKHYNRLRKKEKEEMATR